MKKFLSGLFGGTQAVPASAEEVETAISSKDASLRSLLTNFDKKTRFSGGMLIFLPRNKISSNFKGSSSHICVLIMDGRTVSLYWRNVTVVY